MTERKNFTADFDMILLSHKVYIVILNYNGSEDTIECLESIIKLNYFNYQVLIIDNSETELPYQKIVKWAFLKQIKCDQTNESEFDLKAHQNQFVFVKTQKNKGFAAGNNIALNAILKMQEVDSYIWLLNNDTSVEKESLEAQISYLEKPENRKIGILGSKLIYYYRQDKIQAIGGKFNKRFYISTHLGEGESVDKVKSEFREIDYVIGASMMVPYIFLKEAGILCEDYFLYYEELEWAYKAKKTGWTLDWCSDSIIFHKEGASIGSSYDPKFKSFFSETNVFKSRKIFVKKHFKLGLRFYFSSLLLILNRVRKGKFRLGLELLKITFEK